MGAVCARCNEVQKNKGEGVSRMHPDMAESDDSADGSDGDHSEVAASSDDDGNQEEYKQGVEEILKSTGKNLKRGKTMAMREAISTAKKYGLERSTITEAEKKLDEHKRQQLREEVEKEVEAFFASAASREIPLTEKMVKKATDADCSEKVTKRLTERLDELIITRALEEDEEDLARSYLKQSCRDFVLAATKGGGRPVVLLDLEDGKKMPVSLVLDPPLQHLLVVPDSKDQAAATREVPVNTLAAGRAVDDKKVNKTRAFGSLEDEEMASAVAVRYQADSSSGVLCFVEPTALRRDRLIEALVVLTVSCS